MIFINTLFELWTHLMELLNTPGRYAATAETSWKIPGNFSTKFENSWKSQIFGITKKPFPAKYSAQRNRLEAFPIPLVRFWSKEGSRKLSANSVVWAARFSRLKWSTLLNNLLHWKIKFPLHPYYSSNRTGFPSHFWRPWSFIFYWCPEVGLEFQLRGAQGSD